MATVMAERRKAPAVRVPKLAWIPIAIVLVPSLFTLGHISWLSALLLGIPLSLFSLFIPLAAGYVCRFSPSGRDRWWSSALTHLVAALLLSFLWRLIATPFARALSFIPQLYGLDKQFAQDAWIIYFVGCIVYSLSAAFHYVAFAQDAARQVELKAVETSMLARDAELRALRAQINPHFLFNSLNSISALTSVDGARAREMCLLLADFLRLTLGMGEKSVIPFSEELALLEKFLAIEKVRFGERLRMTESIEEGARQCLIPALLLQPLLENAVSHGIASMADGGTIHLEARVQAGRLGIVVENDRDDEAPSRRRNGVGLKNVRSRLEARYGREASLRTEAAEDRFRVSMSLPAEYAETR
ncbi:MAG TPA: histidine kinase [Dongiaceae bacterium]|nr:histidine kinase [Dongiaceae bacterium]